MNELFGVGPKQVGPMCVSTACQHAQSFFLRPQKTKTVREARHFHRVKFAAASETFQVKKPHFTHDLLSERVLSLLVLDHNKDESFVISAAKDD